MILMTEMTGSRPGEPSLSGSSLSGFGSEYMKGETGSGSGKPSSPPSLEKESGEEYMELGRIRSELIDWLSDDDVISLLYYLRMMDVLNDDKMKTVEGKMTSKDRARCLIDTVMRKGERERSLMVDYLTERHPDLCWTLDLTPTSAWIKLGRIRSELIDWLSDDDVIGLLYYLRMMDVLNDDEFKNVKGKMTSKDKALCLIDTVMRKGERGRSLMVDYMTERHPDLCWTLGLTPTSARIKFERIRSELINRLSEDDVIDLLYYLRMMDVLNDEEEKTVEEKTTSKDRASCLIDRVIKKRERGRSLMVDYMTERHTDLCWILGLTPTSARIKLGRNGSELIDRLSDDDVIDLLHNLRNKNVLNDDEMKTVEVKMTSKDRALCLTDTLMRKGERESRLMVDYLKERHPDLCWTLGLTPTSAWIRFYRNKDSFGRKERLGLMSPSRPLKMHEGDSELDLLSKVERCHIGTSLTEAIASMSLMDRYEEEDGSDSEASTEIDEDDKEDEEEMHFKSRCEKCKAAQQSPEYEKVTPRKISKWSFQVQLKGKGTYECSATGLVFEVSEQALVRYSVLSWSEFSEFLQDSWRPAGSIWNLDVVNNDSSVLKFIHFPHSLCLAGPEHELSFSVLHVKGRHANIESMVDFTASHVKWRVSSLSAAGPITDENAPFHGAVLVYKEQGHQEQFCFHVFLALNTKSEIKAINKQVLSSGKKFINIYKSADCTLHLKGYQLTSVPEGEVRPRRLEFRASAAERKGFFEVIFHQMLTFELFLMDQDEELWTAKITKGDWEGKKVLEPRKRTRAEQSTGQKKKSRWEVMPNNIPLLPDTNRETHSGGQDLTEKQLMTVAETLGQEWEQVAIHLGLETKDLENIKAGQTVAMGKHNMLVRWKRLNPGKATAQHLLSSLEDLQDLPCKTRPLLRGMVNGSLTQPDH